MTPSSPVPHFRSSLAALALAALGCAHLPAATSSDERPSPPVKRVVTGSRIPQYVDVAGGLPATIAPVRIYTSEQLRSTGRPGLGAALGALEPSAR